MSQGNWSEWLGAHKAHSTTPTYVALTDEAANHSNNTNSIPAYPYGPPPPHYDAYPHYNATAPSTAHYGQHQYNTPYYQHQYNPNAMAPPKDYYAHTQKHKHKKKKKKKHRHTSHPPSRPPKPQSNTNLTTSVIDSIDLVTASLPSQSKQYELIVSNVPSQIRSRELQCALNAQKCHLADFYIPNHADPSTIIVVVKGFVQWRQLSKLNEIQIRGTKCPIKPKPLKSLCNTDDDDDDDVDQQKTNEIIIVENENVTQSAKPKEKANEEMKEDNHNSTQNPEEIDLIAHLNELQNVIAPETIEPMHTAQMETVDPKQTAHQDNDTTQVDESQDVITPFFIESNTINPTHVIEENVKDEVDTSIKCQDDDDDSHNEIQHEPSVVNVVQRTEDVIVIKDEESHDEIQPETDALPCADDDDDTKKEKQHEPTDVSAAQQEPSARDVIVIKDEESHDEMQPESNALPSTDDVIIVKSEPHKPITCDEPSKPIVANEPLEAVATNSEESKPIVINSDPIGTSDPDVETPDIDIPHEDTPHDVDTTIDYTEDTRQYINQDTISDPQTHEEEEHEYNVKLEVPDVPDMMMDNEEDIYFVEDNSHAVTYENLDDLMAAELPILEEFASKVSKQKRKPSKPAHVSKKKDKQRRFNEASDVHKKKPSLIASRPLHARKTKKKTKRIPPLSTTNRAPKPPRKVRKSPILKPKTPAPIRTIPTKPKNIIKPKLKYNSKTKRTRVDTNRLPTIAVPRDPKCGISHEVRSMFMSKLVGLSATYHDGMGIIQFKTMLLKMEDMMKNNCQNTTAYKISCGQLLKQYRQIKNIHKLEVYAKEQYVAKNASVKAQTPIERLILNETQLEDNGYPIKTDVADEYSDFVLPPTRKYGTYDLLAIDCEMCQTSKGSELTRISIVDSKLMVVYDKLVKPPNEITDYLTQWSGITPNLLKDVTRTIADVHRDIFAFIDSHTILCGHSLENDLIAMKLIHYKVVDTAVLFMKRHRFRNNKRNIGYSIGSRGGRKISLKQLCDEYLNKKIQSTKGPDGQIIGHSSVEDAIAAMQLLQLQLKWEEERNRKLGISVPDSVTKYAFYSNNNSHEDHSPPKEDKTKQKKVQIMKKKRKKRVRKEPMNDKDAEILSSYGSHKRRKIDSSKHRFNPKSNPNTNRITNDSLRVTSKKEMLDQLFEDDTFIDCTTNTIEDVSLQPWDDESDSEDVAILSPPMSTNKTMAKTTQATIIINGETKTVEIDGNVGHSMLKLDCDGNISCVPQTQISGKKRKLDEIHSNKNRESNVPKKKRKLAPSKLKTKLKQIVQQTAIACDSHSDSEFNEESNDDPIHSVRSLSASPSFPVDMYLPYSNKPPPPPVETIDISDDAEEKDRRKERKYKKRKSKKKKHKKHKDRKHKVKTIEKPNCKTSGRYEYQYVPPVTKSKTKGREKNLEAKAKSIILEWCHKYLNPLFKEHKLTRKEYTSIAKKSVKKILESHKVWTPQNVTNLRTKSKHKVMGVIKGYVKKERHS